ncbi:MAG TPA: hypothetical protein VGL09_21005 [Methylomirabilota bacterium]
MGFVEFKSLPRVNSSDPAYDGFDPSAAPPYLMVPVRGVKFLQLNAVRANVASIASDNPKIATVRPATASEVPAAAKNVCAIEGQVTGTTFVTAKGPKGEELAKVEVAVKNTRKVAVEVFLMSDKKHHTSTTEAEAKEWVAMASRRIFEPQINVKLALKSVRKKKIDRDLGDPIDFGSMGMMPFVKHDSDGDKRWHAITHGADVARGVFNVFCVWDFIHSGDDDQFSAFVKSKTFISASDMAKSGANFNMCMIKPEDKIAMTPAYTVLAHEIGHYLEGFPFHYADTGDYPLMRGDGAIGEHLYKRDAEKMNR